MKNYQESCTVLNKGTGTMTLTDLFQTVKLTIFMPNEKFVQKLSQRRNFQIGTFWSHVVSKIKERAERGHFRFRS